MVSPVRSAAQYRPLQHRQFAGRVGVVNVFQPAVGLEAGRFFKEDVSRPLDVVVAGMDGGFDCADADPRFMEG
jgi:hypothetical protein